MLVALAVIILPMLLGGQAERAQESREIEIPPRPSELSFEKRRFPIGKQPVDSPSTVPEQAPAGEAGGAQDPAVVPESDAPAKTLQERLEEVAAANSAVTGDPATGGEEGAAADDAAPEDVIVPEQQVPDAPVATVTPAQSPEPAPAAAQNASPPPAANDPGEADGRYLVQVASFSSVGNANRLANSLRESGLPVLMDTVESAAGTLNRVRVGPFAQRAEADQVLARLANQIPDLRPRLVDLRPDEESPVTEPEDPLIRWVVQVGVFSGSDNAEKLVFSLRDAGYRAVSRAETADGVTRYRVVVGPEVSRAAAVQLGDRLLAEQGLKGIVQSTE